MKWWDNELGFDVIKYIKTWSEIAKMQKFGFVFSLDNTGNIVKFILLLKGLYYNFHTLEEWVNYAGKNNDVAEFINLAPDEIKKKLKFITYGR